MAEEETYCHLVRFSILEICGITWKLLDSFGSPQGQPGQTHILKTILSADKVV